MLNLMTGSVGAVVAVRTCTILVTVTGWGEVQGLTLGFG